MLENVPGLGRRTVEGSEVTIKAAQSPGESLHLSLLALPCLHVKTVCVCLMVNLKSEKSLDVFLTDSLLEHFVCKLLQSHIVRSR